MRNDILVVFIVAITISIGFYSKELQVFCVGAWFWICNKLGNPATREDRINEWFEKKMIKDLGKAKADELIERAWSKYMKQVGKEYSYFLYRKYLGEKLNIEDIQN